MRIIFEDKKERDNFIKTLSHACPGKLGLKEDEALCKDLECDECWRKSIKDIAGIKNL